MSRLHKPSRTLIGISLAAALLLGIGLSPVRAQVCGNADGAGDLIGNDVFYLFAYLYDNGPPPIDPSDLDDYELITVRDVISLTWYLTEGSPAPTCPPTNPRLVPTFDSTSSLVYDETFPAGVETYTIYIYLQNTDTMAAFTFPLQIRVGGEIPYINEIFFTDALSSFSLKTGRFYGGGRGGQPPTGNVLLGGLDFSPYSSLPPGFAPIAGIQVSMLAADTDRAITMDWHSLPPVENGDSVNYPMLLNNDLSATVPRLIGSCDIDIDGDGVPNCIDACDGFDDHIDADGDGAPDACDICAGYDDFTDSDADGVPDGCDQCPGFDDFADADADGTPDCLDDCTDTDGDGYGDPGFIWNTCAEDNCPDIPDVFQLDTDSDGVGNVCDNCYDLSNPNQADFDGDGVGDLCDNCIASYNPGQEDYDGDGFGNACDVDSPRLTRDVAFHFTNAYNQGSDVWGWTGPDGTDYALMGVDSGIAVAETYPHYRRITVVPGPIGGSALWRDIKTYRHYMYSVSEQSGLRSGLGIADLQYLPDSVHYVGAFSIDGGANYTSHNLSIDTVAGYAYIEGNDRGQPIYVMSLAIPEIPKYITTFDGDGTSGIHDIYAENDTVYVAEGWTSTWSIWDLTDKRNPVMLTRVFVPGNGYLHNIWPTPDHRYCVTTEETAEHTVKIWDISDLNNITMVSEYLGPSRLAHNAIVDGDILWLSHYTSGIVAVDIRDPANPEEIAIFDTYLYSDEPLFWGAWGVYPFTANGQIYGSNMDGDLHVLRLNLGCTTMYSGDLTGDGEIGILDIIFLVNYLLRGGPAPGDFEMADVDCSRTTSIADIIYLVNYIFRAGQQPCEVCIR